MQEWEGVSSIATVEDAVKFLEWQSRLRRESLTAVQASRKVFARPDESATSFGPEELKFYSKKIKSYMSVQDIQLGADAIEVDMSNSVTLKAQERKLLKRKVGKEVLYESKNMKVSIYEDAKPQ
jgi:hypothetical protein